MTRLWSGTAALLVLGLLLTACGDFNNARALPATEAVVTGALTTNGGPNGPVQRVQVYLPDLGVTEMTTWGGAERPITYNNLLHEGDRVLLTRPVNARADSAFEIAEIVRTPVLGTFAVLIGGVLFLLARWRGLAALAGLAASAVGFFIVVIPAIERGIDPLLGTIGLAVPVLVLSVYLVHGLNRKSTVALAGALVGLALVGLLALLATRFGRISGTAGDGAQIAQLPALRGLVDLPRLALAGMMLGGLGALIDMAVGQASATFELAAVDPGLRGWRLYERAMSVGFDHIGALINTLGFAYFAGALPLLVALSARGNAVSLSLNDEGIVFALLSTAVASLGLIACVPITTAIAVRTIGWAVRGRPGPRKRGRPHGGHAH